NNLDPSFAISSRVGKKDRMVAIYAFKMQRNGLGTWGPDSPLFHFKPSAFAMRVNDLILLNASWDWMCSSRCGFPYPQTVERSKEASGMYVASNYRYRNKITHPIFPGLYKSCVTIFQPIVAAGALA